MAEHGLLPKLTECPECGLVGKGHQYDASGKVIFCPNMDGVIRKRKPTKYKTYDDRGYDFGGRMRAEMSRQGMTFQRLSDMTGIHIRLLYRMAENRTHGGLLEFALVANALHVDVGYFVRRAHADGEASGKGK